jgi:hypothetical protein
MRFYTEGRIAEERRLRRSEENEHIRLCNAGVNQTRHVWASEEEEQEWRKKKTEWLQKRFGILK